jgi:hypothetical protein
MEINRYNYEAYLLDLIEGRLSVEDQQHLHDFLLMNPDCTGEIMDIEPWVLERDRIKYPDREHLKRVLPSSSTVLTEYNFDLFSIARMEGDLSKDQEDAHQSMVILDEKRSGQWADWLRTRLVSEPILFRGKDQLKHKRGNRAGTIWITLVSAAAAIALLLVILRINPVLPKQALSLQSSSGTEAFQGVGATDETVDMGTTNHPMAMDTIDRSIVHLDAVENLADQTPTDLQMQKSKSSVMFSVKKDHNGPVELETKKGIAPHDDLEPRPVRVSENHISSALLVSKPVPDQIKPLYVQPVSVHLGSLSIVQITELGPQEIIENYTEENNLSLWTVASAGIRGINKIAGSDISLMASRDEEGEVSGFQLKSKRFSITRPLGQGE